VTGEVGAYLDRLRDYVIAQGITLEYNEGIAPALGAAFGTIICLLSGQDKAEEFTTLVHELAHLMLKHCEHRTEISKTVRETEAESHRVCCGQIYRTQDLYCQRGLYQPLPRQCSITHGKS
jgi:hypothetical protein